ncbi:hypothetical protein [Streptomyces sp. PSAA01]|uniref:hypothetical protein n=1 Tax=Streptomyces sp. PSAA01 TaxID=2912762 RepID=UPI001F1B7D19|nr:hypothetical protein [Streptomyces sp. PSAA01]MCG0287029.1 hypothetical protein [Streptomyces sp. PSAA01]
MAQVRVPFLLGHAEIASLYRVQRQTSQKWRTEGALPAPDLVASGNPYWLLATVLQLDGVGDRHVAQDQLTFYKASVHHGYDVQDKQDLPVILGIQEVARVLARDAQAISRWRNRQQIAEADLTLSGSPLWLLGTIVDDAQQRQRTILPSEVELLRAGHRAPQKPRGRRQRTTVSQPSRTAPPAARTFTSADQTAAAEFLTAVLAEGHSVVIEPQP